MEQDLVRKTHENRQKMHFCLTDLIRGKRTMDEALVLAGSIKDDAWVMANSLLSNHVPTTRVTPDSPPWILADFLWKLCGATQCLTDEFLGRLGPLGEFLLDKMEKEPNTFLDENLRFLEMKDPGFRERAEEILRNRQTQEIRKLGAQGLQFKNDVCEVKRRVSDYNFNPELNELLDKVEDELLKPGDTFDLAATIKHVRTFFEKLHQHVGETLRQKKPETIDGSDLTKCQQAIDYLQRKEVLTERMQALGRALYGVLSYEGVHAISSEQEYVRLCRNMVAEYALVLFYELERRLRA